MAGYLIGEVEEITGVKAHVLRYWEEVIPGIAPKRIWADAEFTLVGMFKQ